jgi:hypothetical protein
MKRLEIDISETLFPLENPTPERIRQQELYSQATQEAEKKVGTKSPISLMKRTNEIYQAYLELEKYRK